MKRLNKLVYSQLPGLTFINKRVDWSHGSQVASLHVGPLAKAFSGMSLAVPLSSLIHASWKFDCKSLTKDMQTELSCVGVVRQR